MSYVERRRADGDPDRGGARDPLPRGDRTGLLVLPEREIGALGIV